MAELYDQNKIYANRPTQPTETPQGADAELEALLAELPPEEREAARAKITAAPTGEDINRAMQERNANGEVFNMNLDQYRLWKSYNKTKEVDVLDTMGQAAEGVFDEIMKAAGSIYDKPLESTAKLTPSLIEAFAQGTRNLYGMAAQSQDPNSVFFRVKNAITANGDDEQTEFQQFMDAQRFNVHSMRLATGQDTLIMDKDVINPEMTQVMSYIADPTLFIPFGGVAAKGARLIGMGETLAKASARASVIQRKVLGGTLKWGVGAPIEFMGTAVRNTIDYGLERAGSAFEVATGMPMAEAQATAKMYGLQTASAALEGRTVGLPIVGDIAGAMVGSTTARGVGEAITMVGEQIGKQAEQGRGVLSYAGQALRDAEKNGVPLSKHAKALLNVLDKVDPLFVYSADISKGAAEGMVIGGVLGGLAGGEEGMASGAGAGIALGSVGAGIGGVVADVGNGRLYDRIGVQRQLVIEALRKIDPDKASAFEAFAKTAELTGNREIIAQVDGIITGIDVMAPNAKFVARSNADHLAWLKSQKIDPKTGRLVEPLALFPEFGTNRAERARALSFLSFIGNRFDGDHKLLIKELQGLPQDHSLRKQFMRLSDEQKKAVFNAIDKAATPESKQIFGGKNGYEFYGALNYAEANVARVNAMFDAGNKTQAFQQIRTFLKDETGKDGKLSARGQLLKDKLATEGYIDKDGNIRPSRLKDIETTQAAFENAKGFVFRRDSTGQVEIHINLNEFGKETAPHELFHAVMMDSVLRPDFIDRLRQNLLGSFDANGKMLEKGSVDIKQVKQFFQRYIDALHGKNSEDGKNESSRLEAAMKEYESRGTTNKLELKTKDTLEGLLEEFGAYYFGAFINDKPVDYLFRGGELGAMREMMGNAKQGFLDFWRSKIKGINPDFNFDPAVNDRIIKAFEKDGIRTKNTSLDLLMRDFVRATAMANKQGGFDVSRLSPAARETFIKNNGIRGLQYGKDANGNTVRMPPRKVIQEQMRVGKEIYKILAGLDPKFRQGLVLDGEGNLSGRLSPEAMEAMVQSGHIDRAWVDKIQQAYNILDGKGGNVIHFGYLGRTAQIGDYAWPRLVGSDVPFKNRQAVLLGVDFKVGKDGKMYSLFHTLDKAVIDGRADVLWSDPAIRTLWNGDRGAMEADFFRYLANASLPSSDINRKTSMALLEDGSGKGSMRRDVLHQMLGIVKAEGDTYLNKPIAEIPYGIRHSVTTFNVDGISNLRVGTDRWNVVPENAFKDLSRNFQPSEMAREETPNGAIIKHASGFKFAEKNGKVHAYTSAGRKIGVYDNMDIAAKAAKSEYSKVYDNIDTEVAKEVNEQNNVARKFQPLDEAERQEAIRLGDVFLLPSMRAFVGDRPILRQTREEHIFQRALEAIENPEQLLQLAEQVNAEYGTYRTEYARLKKELNSRENKFEKEKTAFSIPYYAKLRQLKEKHKVPDSFAQWIEWQMKEGKWNPSIENNGNAYAREAFNRYESDFKDANSKLSADSDFIENQKGYNQWVEYNKKVSKELIDFGDSIDEYYKKNQHLIDNPVAEQLETVREYSVNSTPSEVAKLFADYVEAAAKQHDYKGLLESLFAREYDDQIQTGKPFVAVTTHGTNNVELMLSRLFAADKLGSHYDIPSSRMGSFSAGSQGTSVAYAKKAKNLSLEFRHILERVSKKGIEGNLLVKSFDNSVLEHYRNEYRKNSARLDEVLNKLKELRDNGKEITSDLINEWSDLTSTPLYLGDENMYASVRRTDLLTGSKTVSTPAEFNDYYQKIKKYAIDNGVYQSNFPDKQMQLRKVIRMDNPYVVVDPRSYEEHFISPHMKRAMEAGHDGIIFKRFADGGERDNVYVVFKDYMKDNIKVIDTSFDQDGVPRGSDESGRTLKSLRELGLSEKKGRFQPTEGSEGGRVYDQNGKQWKFGFVGRVAEENPELTKGVSIQHIDKANGVNKLVFTDNSSGESKNIGHISWDKFGGISTSIDPAYRGKGLSYLFYSEAAERMRAQGLKQSVSTIVNKEAIPVKIREAIFGDTRRFVSRSEEGKPISQMEAKAIIAAMQEQGGEYAGVTVSNKIDPNARYQPSEEVQRAAKKAGYNTTVYYHGTPNQFTEFKSDVARTMTSRKGSTAGYFFFTPHADEAKGIHGSDSESKTNVMEVFLSYKKPFNTGMGDSPRFSEADKQKIKDFFREKADYAGDRDYLMANLDGYLKRRELGTALQKYLSRQNRAELLKSLGFDSLIDKGEHIVVFDPEQIKSAADFTYDDEGKQIPLSQRFDKTKKDIRFQPSEYQGGDDYYKPKKNKFESIDDLGLRVRQFVIQDKKGNDIYNTDPDSLSYIQIGHGASNLGGYQFKNVEIKGKPYKVKEVMYFIDNNGKFISQEMHPEATQTHSRYARENNLKMGLHPMGWDYADALQGRVEMPIYEKGKLIRKGIASIVDFGRDKLNSASDVKDAKNTIAERLNINIEDFDLYLFSAKDEVKAQRGYGAKDRLPIKFQPSEGEPTNPRAKKLQDEISFAEKVVQERSAGNPTSPKKKQFLEDAQRRLSNLKFELKILQQDLKNKEILDNNPSLKDVIKGRKFQPTDEESGKEYGGSHKAPSGDNGEGSLDAMDRTYPNDIYTSNGARYYGDGNAKLDKQMHDIIMKAKGNPDAIITVYRAVKKGITRSINKGDWVTPLKAYAFMHGERWHEGADIIKKNVKASELFTEGNSIYEFGYSPKNNSNNAKMQPSEAFGTFKSERTPTGVLLKNAAGFVISNVGNKYRVYNPYKAIIGVYDTEEQAKNRIYKEEPRR